MRELTIGSWEFVALKAPVKSVTDFLVLQPGEAESARHCEQSGDSARPGTTPYKDYLTAIHLTDIEGNRQRKRSSICRR